MLQCCIHMSSVTYVQYHVYHCVTLPLNISETKIEAWFQRTTNRKWPMGNRMVTLLVTIMTLKGEGETPICFMSSVSQKCLFTIANS